jgi:hypothetical protein
MNKTTFFIIIILGVTSCNHEKTTENKTTSLSIENSVWRKIADNSPKTNILEYDLESMGELRKNLRKLPRVDSITFKRLKNKIEKFGSWQDNIEVFYYSKNRIDNLNIGILLSIIDFNGNRYAFDLIGFDKNGEVKYNKEIANYWFEVECLGYKRAFLDLESSTMINEIIQKCYNEESINNEQIDSIINTVSLNNMDFQLIKTDTIN